MACRLTIDLSPPLSPALLPPEVYADLYKSYVSTYRALGFALMGRTNAPKSQPAPPPKERTDRPPKPVVKAPVPDTATPSPGLARGRAADPSVASYTRVAAGTAPAPPSPPPSSPPDMSMSNHSVKVVPDAQPQPKPKRVTPARSQVNPGVSESGNLAFDAVMSDVDSTPPTASSKGKSPASARRPPGVPGTFQVSQIWGPYPLRLPARGFTEDLKVMVIEDPDIVSLTKQLEEGAVPENGFTFPSAVDSKLTEAYQKFVGDSSENTRRGTAFVLRATPTALKRMETSSERLVTKGWHIVRSIKEQKDKFWIARNDDVLMFRLIEEFGFR